MPTRFLAVLLVSASLSLLASTAGAAQLDVGSTGADGFFNPQSNVEIDLGAQGTYDPARWAVIFHYTDVLVPAGVTVTFKNHPARAPVVWLVQGNVTIHGTVDLDGKAANTFGTYAEPGPGGFRGGIGMDRGPGWNSSSGFGPGGGVHSQSQTLQPGSAGSYATAGDVQGSIPSPRYNNPAVFQLLGGSGGAAAVTRQYENSSGGGGGGGGAILIAANGLITISGTGWLHANGGIGASGYGSGAGGSGGALRLLADTISLGQGAVLRALGGTFYLDGGEGRIRLEANSFDLPISTNPPASTGTPREVFPPAGSPVCRVHKIGSSFVTVDPRGGLGLGNGQPDLALPTSDPTDIVIQTEGVPLDWKVFLRVTGAFGPAYEIQVTDGITNALQVTGGPNLQAETTISVDLADGFSALQARAVHPTQGP